MTSRKTLNARKLVLSVRPTAFLERRKGKVNIKRFFGEYCSKCTRWGTRYEIIGSGNTAAEAWYAAARDLGLTGGSKKTVK